MTRRTAYPIDGATGLQDVIDRLEVVRPTLEVGGTWVTVGHSMGAVLVGAGKDLNAALRRADAETYVRKRASADPAPAE